MKETTTTPRLQGASNFRDLGGCSGLDGRRVRHGLVYRSDHFAALTPDDHSVLESLQITHSLDFRGVAESAAQPSLLPDAAAVSLPIEPTVVSRIQDLLAVGHVPSEAETVEWMVQTYRCYALDATPVYARFFRHLVEQPTPVVFHCTAGKDRTGFAAALLLTALGVDRDAVMADYLLTNQRYRRSAAMNAHGPAHVMEVLWQVQSAFLEAAFDTVERVFGGLPQYLQGPMNLGPQALSQLRGRLLEE